MWKPYLNVIAEMLPKALNVLDRFHIAKKLGEAVDQVRKDEAARLHREGYDPVLKKSKYCFLKRPENLTANQALKLDEVLQYDLKTSRAYFLKESFDAFWQYNQARWTSWFLQKWCARAMRSKLDPMKKFVPSTSPAYLLTPASWPQKAKIVHSSPLLQLSPSSRPPNTSDSFPKITTAVTSDTGHFPGSMIPGAGYPTPGSGGFSPVTGRPTPDPTYPLPVSEQLPPGTRVLLPSPRESSPETRAFTPNHGGIIPVLSGQMYDPRPLPPLDRS